VRELYGLFANRQSDVHGRERLKKEERNGNRNKKKELSITRIFDAPRDNVWKAWSDPELFKRWWGPKDFTAPHISIDFRPGGKYVYCMRGAGLDGVVKDFWNPGRYREIVPREKIAATISFADEHGNPSRPHTMACLANGPRKLC